MVTIAGSIFPLSSYPLLPRLFAREKVPEGRMRATFSQRSWEKGKALQLDQALNDVALERDEAVEGDGRIGARIGSRLVDQHLSADGERHRQVIERLLVEHVGGIAGRPRDHARRLLIVIPPGEDRIADGFLHRLGEAAELADIEIDPSVPVS